MVKYKLVRPVNGTVVTVSLSTKTADEVGELLYEGEDRRAVQEVRQVIERSAGIYGHLLGERTSALDLDVAVKRNELAVYSPELIEGKVPEDRTLVLTEFQT